MLQLSLCDGLASSRLLALIDHKFLSLDDDHRLVATANRLYDLWCHMRNDSDVKPVRFQLVYHCTATLAINAGIASCCHSLSYYRRESMYCLRQLRYFVYCWSGDEIALCIGLGFVSEQIPESCIDNFYHCRWGSRLAQTGSLTLSKILQFCKRD